MQNQLILTLYHVTFARRYLGARCIDVHIWHHEPLLVILAIIPCNVLAATSVKPPGEKYATPKQKGDTEPARFDRVPPNVHSTISRRACLNIPVRHSPLPYPRRSRLVQLSLPIRVECQTINVPMDRWTESGTQPSCAVGISPRVAPTCTSSGTMQLLDPFSPSETTPCRTVPLLVDR